MRIVSQWSVSSLNNDSIRDTLCKELSISPVTATCLINRGIENAESARDFLNPKLQDLKIPKNMADLEKGATRVAEAIMAREKIAVFGDYDVDGLTSLALMYQFLRMTASIVEVKAADRFSGGYGLDIAVVDKFIKQGCQVLIVLDCGTSDHKSIMHAKKAGIDVIVVDHHRIDRAYPDSFAFINPHRSDCGFGDKSMAAVGLTFYFCATICSELINSGFIKSGDIDMRKFLDFVALGTIADVVPLGRNNRILTRHGLKFLTKNNRPGVKALLDIARIHTRRLTSSHVSFQIAPRINAAGRLSNAMHAFELLVSTVEADAREYAQVLEKFTLERRVIESEVTQLARQMAQKQVDNGVKSIVVGDRDWHKGVLGIVAARLSEEFNRPTYIVGFENGIGTGSARGQGQISLFDSLENVSSLLIRYGGHRDAAGFSLAEEQFDEFAQKLNNFANTNWKKDDFSEFFCDATLTPGQIEYSLFDELARLGPFGPGNAEPVFNIVGLDVLNARVVGGSHLKLLLKTPGGAISAFGPGMGDAASDMPQIIKVAATLALDEWKKDDSVELRLVAPPVACDV